MFEVVKQAAAEEDRLDVGWMRFSHLAEAVEDQVTENGLPTPAALAYRVQQQSMILPTACPAGINELGAPPRQRLVSQGIRLPLEVFKTKGRGWGVRCSSVIPGGTFVCEYAGRLLTDSQAEAIKAADLEDALRHDDYFFGMDHYYYPLEDAAKRLNDKEQQQGAPLPPDQEELRRRLQPRLDRLEHAPVIDAKAAGNVGRFINHSASEPNLIIQTVFTSPMHSTLFYRVAFFAARDIEPYEELLYDYGYSHGSEEVMPDWAREDLERSRQGNGGEGEAVEGGGAARGGLPEERLEPEEEQAPEAPELNQEEPVVASASEAAPSSKGSDGVIDLTLDDEDDE